MKVNEKLEALIVHLQQINRFLRSSVFEQKTEQVTRVQWLILRHLRRNGPRTIGELATQLDVRSSTMSQMIDRLEKNAWVCRTVDDHDARVKLIHLTDHGNALMNQIELASIENMAQPFEQLSDDEQAQLVQLLKKLSSFIPKKEGKREA
jgi:DNA-binding MarR family transcriptional regulator